MAAQGVPAAPLPAPGDQARLAEGEAGARGAGLAGSARRAQDPERHRRPERGTARRP